MTHEEAIAAGLEQMYVQRGASWEPVNMIDLVRCVLHEAGTDRLRDALAEIASYGFADDPGDHTFDGIRQIAAAAMTGEQR